MATATGGSPGSRVGALRALSCDPTSLGQTLAAWFPGTCPMR